MQSTMNFLYLLSPLKQVEFPKELKAELFPHHMERTNMYASTSVLGLIYDAVQSRQTQTASVGGLFHFFYNIDLFG